MAQAEMQMPKSSSDMLVCPVVGMEYLETHNLGMILILEQ